VVTRHNEYTQLDCVDNVGIFCLAVTISHSTWSRCVMPHERYCTSTLECDIGLYVTQLPRDILNSQQYERADAATLLQVIRTVSA
jgi:hypothetical protein